MPRGMELPMIGARVQLPLTDASPSTKLTTKATKLCSFTP